MFVKSRTVEYHPTVNIQSACFDKIWHDDYIQKGKIQRKQKGQQEPAHLKAW